MTKVFYVFTIAKRTVREGTGLIGWRDKYSMDTRRGAEKRRKELKADPPEEQKYKTLRRIIKTEEWA